MSVISYTDYSWLQELVRDGVFGPIEHPTEFHPLHLRLSRVLRENPVDLYPISFSIGYDQESCYGRNTVKVHLVDGVIHYTLNSVQLGLIKDLLSQSTQGPLRTYWRILCSHLQFSLFFKSSCDGGLDQKPFFFDFGDSPKTDQSVLAYCTNKANDFCLVDPFFINSNGYAGLKKKLSSKSANLFNKKDKVFWRGSLSGVKDNNILSSQRFLLCHLANQSSFSYMLDFGLINTPSKYLDRVHQEFGFIPDWLASQRVDHDEFANYRYGIDVDGNSNSWGGFFTKMLSRSFLVKIKSPLDYRQWYYSRIDEKCFLKMAADLSDYDEVFTKAFELTMDEKQERVDMLYEFGMSMDVISEIRLNNQGLRQWLTLQPFTKPC